MKRKKQSIPCVVVTFPHAKTIPTRIAFVGPLAVKMAKRVVAESNKRK